MTSIPQSSPEIWSLALRCDSFRGRRTHRRAVNTAKRGLCQATIDDFVQGKRPADFPKGQDEIGFVGVGRPEDVVNPLGRRAMGAPVEVIDSLRTEPCLGLTFDQIAKELGKDEIWVASAFYGQAKFTPDQLKKVAEVVGVNAAELVQDLGDHWWPNRGLGPIPPTDPVIYRLYEVRLQQGVLVYGHAIKAVIHEKSSELQYPRYGDDINRRWKIHSVLFSETRQQDPYCGPSSRVESGHIACVLIWNSASSLKIDVSVATKTAIANRSRTSDQRPTTGRWPRFVGQSNSSKRFGLWS
ncbi:Cyanate hydratase [Salix suchowensis]|nr:Cyanate hydratase [Salix suchowensis]